jgi:3-methyladenine DNA glycosylase/8-oxoguanine DNA glycosylase
MPGAAAGRRRREEARRTFTPSWPYRLPAGGGPDGVSRVRGGAWERLLTVAGRSVLVRAWQQRRRDGRVEIAAIPVPEHWRRQGPERLPARREELEIAVERARHALAIGDDLGPFYASVRSDPLLGPAVRARPWTRPRRCPWPWEALAWAITEQLIEVERAIGIQRRIVRRWGDAIEVPGERRLLYDVPHATTIAACAPAELAALDLAPKRATAMIEVAREVAAGRCDPGDPAGDRRLLGISDIGPWTIQILGLRGRGDHDALPAGDLAYLKLVGHLSGEGRRATVEEVERHFAPYAPFRALAGLFALIGARPAMRTSRPLRYHPPRPDLEAA